MEGSMPKLDPQQILTLAGRKFHAVSHTTLEQDIYVLDLVNDAGLQQLAEKYNSKEQDIGDIAHDVVLTAFRSGKLFRLLGAVMVEQGKEWSLESAKTNAKFFSSLSEPVDKKELHASIVAVILGFFVSGLLVSMTSKTSSVQLEAVQESVSSPTKEEPIALVTGE